MTQHEAKIKAAIRAMYQDRYSKYLVEKTLKDCHNEVKQFFNIN